MNFLRRKQQQQLIEIQDPRHDGLNGSPFPLPPPPPCLADRLYSSVDAARLRSSREREWEAGRRKKRSLPVSSG